MAQGRYAPLYTHVEQELIAKGQRLTLEVLRGLAWFCDPYGLTYVGVGKIAESIKRADQTVINGLAQLEALGFICIHERYDPFRRRVMVDYQISPHVIYIREELEAQALVMWENRNVNVTFVMKESQPESGTRIQYQTQNPEPDPNTNQHHHQTVALNATPDPAQRAAPPADYANREAGDAENAQHQRAALHQRTAQPSIPTPRSAPPPPHPARCAEPLPEAAEALARQIAEVGTRLPQARSLVLQYDQDMVAAGLAWLRYEMGRAVKGERDSIARPVGLLKSWLANNHLAAGDLPPHPATANFTKDVRRYVSGDSAEFIHV